MMPLSIAGWGPLNREFRTDYMRELDVFLEGERAKGVDVHPPKKDIFKAFESTALKKVKVVILGQDPYHDGKAMGLAFSVRNKRLTTSLHNIYAAIEADLGSTPARSGDLTPWTEDGVLLLNTILTVDRKPKSHARRGWECFTNRAITVISEEREGVIFLLWGKEAWNKAKLIDTKRHYVLPAAHPRAGNAHLKLSRCRHFSLTNCLLAAQGHKPIRWLRA